MAKAFNIIILLFFIGFVYFQFYQINPVAFGGKQKFFQNLTGVNGTVESFANSLPINLNTNTGLSALGLGALIIGTIVFPNPYTLFALPAAALLTVYFAINDLTSGVGLPSQINAIFTILGFAFLVYLVGWYKGNE